MKREHTPDYDRIQASESFKKLQGILDALKLELHMKEEGRENLYENRTVPMIIQDLAILQQQRQSIKRKKAEREVLLVEKKKLIEQQKLLASEVNQLKQNSQWFNSKWFFQTDYEMGRIPKRNKTHRDYMLEEMAWLANDFREERLWKRNISSKISFGVRKFFQKRQAKEEKRLLGAENTLKKRASKISQLVMEDFWGRVKTLVTHVNEQRKIKAKNKVLERKRDMIVKESQKMSALISQSMKKDNNGKNNSKLSQIEKLQKTNKMTETSTLANEITPKGTTLESTSVKVKIPALFTNTEELHLREYQHIGLDWLVTMHDKGLNGILADEMGLGKTIQTIALLAHLICEKHIWGQHLIIVPASVVLNWEVELKRWCPYFKILTYYGTPKQRAEKRRGWNNPETFNVCITSYSIVIRDIKAFRRKEWYYMILDEAQNIKNFRSAYWQKLLPFKTKSRLLLTGTPLQNSLMELWALMHFLMPQVFESHVEFKEWFSNPLEEMASGQTEVNNELIQRLHSILRPFILRRMKANVEKQLPSKTEKILKCDLSKRQKFLYEEFMQRSNTQQTLASGNVLKILNVLMQLRKVCNHPDLFAGRKIVSSFDMNCISYSVPSLVRYACEGMDITWRDLNFIGLNFVINETKLTKFDMSRIGKLLNLKKITEYDFEKHRPVLSSVNNLVNGIPSKHERKTLEKKEKSKPFVIKFVEKEPFYVKIYKKYILKNFDRYVLERKNTLKHRAYVSEWSSHKTLLYGRDCLDIMKMKMPLDYFSENYLVQTRERRFGINLPVLKNYAFVIPKVRAKMIEIRSFKEDPHVVLREQNILDDLENEFKSRKDITAPVAIRLSLYFPDKRLIEFDCGKLRRLGVLLKQLKKDNHRCLIFTQMSKVLDILEKFLCLHGHSYFRLDGTTKIEERQYLTEKFNSDISVFCFILSTRSGGLGINLTGADTVIFYDSDWNPAMDAQAQDRCHRIGQTKNVTIYRLITEHTIEEKILRKANEKRRVNEMVITKGSFTSEFFRKLDVNEFFGIDQIQKKNEEVDFTLMDEDEDEDGKLLDDDDDDIDMNVGKSEREVRYDSSHVNGNKIVQEKTVDDEVTDKEVEKMLLEVEDEDDRRAFQMTSNEIEMKPSGKKDYEEFMDKQALLEKQVVSELRPIEKNAYFRVKNELEEQFNYEIKSIISEEQGKQKRLKTSLRGIQKRSRFEEFEEGEPKNVDEILEKKRREKQVRDAKKRKEEEKRRLENDPFFNEGDDDDDDDDDDGKMESAVYEGDYSLYVVSVEDFSELYQIPEIEPQKQRIIKTKNFANNHKKVPNIVVKPKKVNIAESNERKRRRQKVSLAQRKKPKLDPSGDLDWSQMEDDALLWICKKYGIEENTVGSIDWSVITEELKMVFAPFCILRTKDKVRDRFLTLKRSKIVVPDSDIEKLFYQRKYEIKSKNINSLNLETKRINKLRKKLSKDKSRKKKMLQRDVPYQNIYQSPGMHVDTFVDEWKKVNRDVTKKLPPRFSGEKMAPKPHQTSLTNMGINISAVNQHSHAAPSNNQQAFQNFNMMMHAPNMVTQVQNPTIGHRTATLLQPGMLPQFQGAYRFQTGYRNHPMIQNTSELLAQYGNIPRPNSLSASLPMDPKFLAALKEGKKSFIPSNQMFNQPPNQ